VSRCSAVLRAAAVTFLLTSCGTTAPPAAAPVPADSAATVMYRGLIAALQADGDGAAVLLRRIHPTDLDPRSRGVHACMLGRLDGRELPAMTLTDPFVGGVLGAYQEYWLRSLRHEHPADQNERWLLARLDRLVQRNGGLPAPSLNASETQLAPMLQARGYYSLFGVTSPLRELMLWKDETEQRYDVALPQGRQTVTVVFLDGFVSLGWAGFATCDRHHTGGWTKPDRLYAVRSAYDTTSENFRVSYLAHEGQHFWDTQHLPEDTPAWRREYRAKLAELAVGQGTVHALLAQFAGNTSADSTVPHSYANARVVEGMAARLFPGITPRPSWRDAAIDRINVAATALLQADSSGTRP
jgi:hypothetical protein